MKMFWKEVWALIKKEILLELRQQYALNGILLYIISTVFICYLSFNTKSNQLNPITWNALFWIILLFSAVNSVAKSFIQEREGRHLFYYTLASPQAIIFSKIVYNCLLLTVLSLVGILVYSVILGNPVQDMRLFIGNLILGAVGFSGTLTLIAGIAAKSNNVSTLMAVLGFPVILPMLVMLIKVSKNAIDGLAFSDSNDEILTIFAIDMIVMTTSMVLFPYLWKS